MKPYYEHAGITIYHGDCREILPTLPKCDLLLTDPPYPGLKGGTNITFNTGVAKSFGEFPTVGTPWGSDITPLVEAVKLTVFGALVFCSFHSVDLIPPMLGMDKVALLCWYQRNSMPSACNAPHFQTEYIWALKKSPGLEWRKLRTHYDIPRLQSGCMATERFCDNGRAVHPAQKPLDLMIALLAVGGDTVLDPYCGTGTTILAAKQLGRKAIGIEIEERYCEIAAKRLSQEVFDFQPERELST